MKSFVPACVFPALTESVLKGEVTATRRPQFAGAKASTWLARSIKAETAADLKSAMSWVCFSSFLCESEVSQSLQMEEESTVRPRCVVSCRVIFEEERVGRWWLDDDDDDDVV